MSKEIKSSFEPIKFIILQDQQRQLVQDTYANGLSQPQQAKQTQFVRVFHSESILFQFYVFLFVALYPQKARQWFQKKKKKLSFSNLIKSNFQKALEQFKHILGQNTLIDKIVSIAVKPFEQNKKIIYAVFEKESEYSIKNLLETAIKSSKRHYSKSLIIKFYSYQDRDIKRYNIKIERQYKNRGSYKNSIIIYQNQGKEEYIIGFFHKKYQDKESSIIISDQEESNEISDEIMIEDSYRSLKGQNLELLKNVQRFFQIIVLVIFFILLLIKIDQKLFNSICQLSSSETPIIRTIFNLEK